MGLFGGLSPQRATGCNILQHGCGVSPGDSVRSLVLGTCRRCWSRRQPGADVAGTARRNWVCLLVLGLFGREGQILSAGEVSRGFLAKPQSTASLAKGCVGWARQQLRVDCNPAGPVWRGARWRSDCRERSSGSVGAVTLNLGLDPQGMDDRNETALCPSTARVIGTPAPNLSRLRQATRPADLQTPS